MGLIAIQFKAIRLVGRGAALSAEQDVDLHTKRCKSRPFKVNELNTGGGGKTARAIRQRHNISYKMEKPQYRHTKHIYRAKTPLGASPREIGVVKDRKRQPMPAEEHIANTHVVVL